ncbi:MAG TPA: STAS domain-containing protein [Casimicrobiaceae bacterium]
MNDELAETKARAVGEDRGRAFVSGARWAVHGALTVDSAAAVLDASRHAELPETGVVALGGAHPVDSAAVAVLLSWKRRAAAEGKRLTFADAPASLKALAELYGVEDLLEAGQ